MAPGPIYPYNPWTPPRPPGRGPRSGYAQQLIDIPQNFGSSFADIGGRAASAGVGGPGSAMDDLMRRLMASMAGGGGGYAPSQGSLEQEARNEAAMQFDPQIAALRRAMNAAKTNAAYSKTAIGKLFKGLAESYGENTKESKKMFKEAKESEKARLKDYSNTVKDNYADSMHALAETYKKLGIEAAAGDSTTGALAKDEAFRLQQGAQESATEQKALNQESVGDLQYWNSGSGTAKMEGTQRQADLQQTLNAFLTEKQGQLADLQAQQKIAYQVALQKLQQQVAQQAADQSNKAWSQLMQLGNFQMSVGRYNAEMNKPQAIGKGLTGANNYLYQQFVNSQWGPSEAERYSGILQGLVLQLPSGISPEEAAQFAANEANRRGISPSVMARAMLAYYGRA